MEAIDLDLEQSFEAPFRARSNTWPLPRPEIPDNFVNTSHEGDSLDVSDKSSANLTLGSNESGTGLSDPVIPTTAHEPGNLDQASGGAASGPKKNTSRRNAWGNMSYADLITQAIQSSPDKRLTLSQIYDWMVQNVPYFKDKGDSNSSAGWKNSIRHNLSLHNRFMRVQNEGTGKSSWWMINPDAKPGKAARRRATSMETQKYEKKRGRVKKKVEALRNGIVLEPNTSPSSSVSEGLDVFPESPLHHGFQLSPDFRPRASSNASSCGRLSPIPAVESDMHDSQVPPLSPLSGWNSDLGRLYNPSELPDQYNTEQLVEMANTMKLGGGNAFLGVTKSSPTSQLSPASSHPTLNSSSFTTLTNFGSSVNTFSNSGSGTLSRNGSDPYFQQAASIENNITLTSLNSLNGSRSPARLLSGDGLSGSATFSLHSMSPSLSPSQSMDTLSAAPSSTPNYHSPQHQSVLSSKQANSQIRGAYASALDGNAMIRAMAGSKCLDSSSPHTPTNSSGTSLGTTASQVMGHLLSLNNPLPNDLDFDSLQGGLECDVDQVIRHELSVDGNLDFNFDSIHGANTATTAVSTSMATVAAAAAAASNRPWVH